MLRILLRAGLLIVALRGIGALVSRRGTEGDASSDQFSVSAILDGVDRVSRATSLREGDVLACCGGVQLDLREATLDPGGADIRLRAYMAGIQLLVPEDWRVVVQADTKAGDVDTNVTAEGDLDENAPELRIHALAVLGGVQVTREDDGRDAGPATSEGLLQNA